MFFIDRLACELSTSFLFGTKGLLTPLLQYCNKYLIILQNDENNKSNKELLLQDIEYIVSKIFDIESPEINNNFQYIHQYLIQLLEKDSHLLNCNMKSSILEKKTFLSIFFVEYLYQFLVHLLQTSLYQLLNHNTINILRDKKQAYINYCKELQIIERMHNYSEKYKPSSAYSLDKINNILQNKVSYNSTNLYTNNNIWLHLTEFLNPLEINYVDNEDNNSDDSLSNESDSLENSELFFEIYNESSLQYRLNCLIHHHNNTLPLKSVKNDSEYFSYYVNCEKSAQDYIRTYQVSIK